MDKNNVKGIIIGVLISIIIIGAICAILNATNVVSFSSKHNSKNMNDGNAFVDIKAFYGTYKWHKYYTNEEGIDIRLNVKLVLNEDGTATYDAGDGYSYEATKGTYKLIDGKIVYTREFYNYENQENGVFDEPNKTETFEIIDKNTLQNSFNHQTTALRKLSTADLQVISTIVGKYEYTYSFIQSDVSDENECKTINLNETLELNADETFTYGRGANCSGGESASGTYSISDNKIYLYNQECVEDGNCRKEIVLTFSKNNDIITIKDNESTSGWKSNSTWGSTKLPETILQRVN